MNQPSKQSKLYYFILLLLSLLADKGYAQTSVTMTLQNLVQTAPNVFEYDMMLKNTGTTAVSLRGYSWGINHATGLANGGTITHSYLSREASLSTLPVPTFAYTAATSHLRVTTTNANAGLEVPLMAGVPVRLATMRVTCTANFPSDFDPAFTLQLIAASGKTSCLATCIVTPPGTSFAINAPGNNPVAGSLQFLTGIINTPCPYLNRSANFSANVVSNTSPACYGQSTASTQIVLSGTGSAAPLGTIGSYTINGGASLNYNGNPFTVSNLNAGLKTIMVTTSFGCTDTANVVITQPALIGSSSSASACNSYTWNGTTYTASGFPTTSYVSASGCDSVETLNLTIHPSITTNSFVTSPYSYTWAANSVTYTNSGTYTSTFTDVFGCDSTSILHLSIMTLSVNTDQDVSCFGSNDGTILATATSPGGSFAYDIDGGNLYNNLTGYFFNLTPGIHTVCAKELSSNTITCGTAVIAEPDLLTAYFVVDTLLSCGNNSNGQLSLVITGGTANLQPYLTIWTNANGDTVNDLTNDPYSTTLSNLTADTYQVRIEDDHACVINVDTTLLPGSCDDTLHLKLFIEGYYAGASTMSPVLLNENVSLDPTVTDTIVVELHDATSPYALVASVNAILKTDGTATCIFPSVTGSYYIAVKHRNALQTWSALPVSFATLVNYDFSTAATQAYGSNMIEIQTGIWSFYSGDLNNDENIDLLDNSILEADVANFEFGYFATDLNGDGNVDLLDAPILEANINNFIFSNHP